MYLVLPIAGICHQIKVVYNTTKYTSYTLSVYDTNIFFCLFERPFKIQNNGVFLIEISFFVLKILTFFYQANWINDDVIILQLKRGKNGINDISGTIKAVFLKLGTINVHHKRSKLHPQCCCQKQNIPIYNLQSETKGST